MAPLKVVAPKLLTWPVAFVKVPFTTIAGLDDAAWLPNVSWLSKIIVPLTVTVPAVIPTIALAEVPCISKVAPLPTIIFPLPIFISSSTWTLPIPEIVRSLFSEPCLVITVSEFPSYNLKVSPEATPILASAFNWIVELLKAASSAPPLDRYKAPILLSPAPSRVIILVLASKFLSWRSKVPPFITLIDIEEEPAALVTLKVPSLILIVPLWEFDTVVVKRPDPDLFQIPEPVTLPVKVWLLEELKVKVPLFEIVPA